MTSPNASVVSFSPTPVCGATLLRAELAPHRFDRHVHDTYSFGVTLDGVQSFHCRGASYASVPGHIMAFNPGEAHDGHPSTDQGFAYFMLYVDSKLLGGGESAAAAYFKQPCIADPALARRFMQAVCALQPQETLRAQNLLQDWLLRLSQRHGSTAFASSASASDMRASAMRDYLEANYATDVSAPELAQLVGVSRVHANRIFTQCYGIAPHAYLNSVRVKKNKKLIQSGVLLADAALAAGFADQAHMTRRFVRSVGVSPRRWQRMLQANNTLGPV